MKKLNKIRLMMVGLLCSGLLIVGIGFGIGFGELSQFTYAGSKLLSDATSKNFTDDVELFHQDGQVYIDVPFFNDPLELQDCLVTSESVKPGTIHIEAGYHSVISVPTVHHYLYGDLDTDDDEALYLSWSASPIALFFAYKDEILTDIQSRRLGDYQECEFSNLVITVNPADKDRIIFK